MVADGRYKCTACGRRTSVTAGTLFDRRRTPLTVWFAACWMFATQKDGVSALSLQRALEIGSYPTAWAMLHRLRSVLVRGPQRRRAAGAPQRAAATARGGADQERPRHAGRRRPGRGLAARPPGRGPPAAAPPRRAARAPPGPPRPPGSPPP